MDEVKRILIKNDDKLYLLFSIILKKDRYDQSYIKVAFPNLLNENVGIRTLKKGEKSYSTELPLFASKIINQKIEEFGYHYESGIVTLKGDGKSYRIIHNKPDFLKNNLIHLCRFYLRETNLLKEYSKKTSISTHAVLPINFSKKGYIFNLSLCRTNQVQIINTDAEELDPIGNFSVDLPNSIHVILSIDITRHK